MKSGDVIITAFCIFLHPHACLLVVFLEIGSMLQKLVGGLGLVVLTGLADPRGVSGVLELISES
jgi:hypothetical protein